MRKVIHESVCDRCGRTYASEEDYDRGSSLIGKAYDMITRLPKHLLSRSCDVKVRLYYMSHYRYTTGEQDRIVDLCEECKSELAEWFNKPGLDRDA